MTAQSALARLASMFKIKLNDLGFFFFYTKWINDRDISRGWTTHWSWFHSQKTEQKPRSVCPSEAGSFCHLVLKKVRKGHMSVMFIRHPLLHFLLLDMMKTVWFLLFCCESEINYEHSGFFLLSSGVRPNLVMDLTTMRLTYLTHFICLWVVSMWYICQQLRLCVFLQFNIFFSPCLSGCWELLQSVTFKKSHNRAPQDKYFCCSNHFLSHSIHYIGTVRETPSHGQHTRSKSSISSWYFSARTYSLILCVFQGTINKN